MTILIPAKNAQHTILKALHSVSAQLDPHWDIQVLVDKSSSDNTLAKAREFRHGLAQRSKRRPQVHVNVSQNPSLPYVYKELIDRAEPDDDICGFLDADDWLAPMAVGVVRAKYRSDPSLGCVWTQFSVNNTMRSGWSKALPPGKTLREALSGSWWGAQHFRTFRKSVYLSSPYKIQLDIAFATDYNLALILAASDCPCAFINERLYNYMRTPGSITATNREAQRANCQELGRRFRKWSEGQQKK